LRERGKEVMAIERMKGQGMYSEVPEDGIEILGGDLIAC